MLELADKDITMDWEGGTIGAIVPALMGYGEAGRASPWPFFMRNALQADLIAYGLEAVVFLRIFERVIRYAFYENSCCMIDPSRTSVMGRPVELLNSVEGSIPKLW